jgi:membrane associated rhomboid family serine protease
MFLLLPYAHERQTLQRLPWITFALIAINCVVFLFTHYISGIDEEKLNEYMNDFYKQYYSHPYLHLPEQMAELLTPRERDELELLRHGTDLSAIPNSTIKEEQKELDKTVGKVLDTLNENPFRQYGYTPKYFRFTTLFTCLFIHTGWVHLVGNMLFLFLVGCAIEDIWGRPLYTAFYFLSGIVATLAHHLIFPGSTVPLVGASGAIAGLMGAFLVRLYNTKITFFYFVWFLITRIRMGSFQAPAFVMLPLWLLQQIVYVAIMKGESGVAFWAHIGGFIFGALFALLIKTLEVEEKYIAPGIERKVSIVQNPLFLKAITLSDAGDYPNALLMLQSVVKKDPNHLDAYLEMRRIVQINKDAANYTRYSGAIFDILIRMHDWDFLIDLYNQFQESPLKHVLPAKTLLSLASRFEETQDYTNATRLYEELVENYPDDAIAMKAWSVLARLYLEKLGLREKANEAFRKSYDHKLASEEWRSALQMERKRFEIPVFEGGTVKTQDASTMKKSDEFEHAELRLEDLQEIHPISMMEFEGEPAPEAEEPPPMIPSRPIEPSLKLPDPHFDGKYSVWTTVFCQIDRIGLKGLILQSSTGLLGLLPWRRIQLLSVARVPMSDPADTLSIDFVLINPDTSYVINYRTTNSKLRFERLFPGVEQSYFEAYQNLIGILLTNSGAKCFPDKDHCLGPVFASYPNIGRYESDLKSQLRT